MSAGSRDAILGRIRRSLEGMEPPALPDTSRPVPVAADEAVDLFVRRFLQNGGEVVRFASPVRARAWLAGLSPEFRTVAPGAGVPSDLVPPLPEAPPEFAALGVSMARLAVAETGSLLLDARGGRRPQLLPPCHLVWVREGCVVGSLAAAFAKVRGDLPSALALHSGPSRSADIGQIMVQGVHGPGRVIVGILPGAGSERG